MQAAPAVSRDSESYKIKEKMLEPVDRSNEYIMSAGLNVNLMWLHWILILQAIVWQTSTLVRSQTEKASFNASLTNALNAHCNAP